MARTKTVSAGGGAAAPRPAAAGGGTPTAPSPHRTPSPPRRVGAAPARRGPPPRPPSRPAPRAPGPATSGRRERGAGLGGAAEGSAPRSPFPSTTTSAGSALRARAFATTSGPIPRGSPRVTARRGRGATALEADVHVGGASQQVEIVLLGEPLAQRVADPILHVLEGELALQIGRASCRERV